MYTLRVDWRLRWRRPSACALVGISLSALLICNGVAAAGVEQSGRAEPAATTPPAQAPPQLPQVVVQAPEPRFVAPTRRDKIGRIWAPVLISGRGPFRFVLDTGANRSSITRPVADSLGAVPDPSSRVMLHGVTGAELVPLVRVDSFEVGDLTLAPAILPTVTDALGGAEGVLGQDALTGMRISIDFKHDAISIGHSHHERAPPGFVSIPLERSPSNLLVVRATIGNERVRAIIDTGGQATIGNYALRAALVSKRAHGSATQVIDVTTTEQGGEIFLSPPIELGGVTIQGARIIYGDMRIFEHWHLTDEPAVLIGMDVIGLLNALVIDYAQHRLYLRTSPTG